jgi:hypothetical protein
MLEFQGGNAMPKTTHDSREWSNILCAVLVTSSNPLNGNTAKISLLPHHAQRYDVVHAIFLFRKHVQGVLCAEK